MTNEQINRMAAEALGMCWHSWDKYATCSKCKEFLAETPDFCNDLNAAQKLLHKLPKNDEIAGDRFEFVIGVYLNENPCLDGRDLIALFRDTSPKTITLAALAALGKMTLEEAKEILK